MKKPRAFQAELGTVNGISWPPLATGLSASLATLMHQLEETQWLPTEEIERLQHRQLLKVAAHAEKHSPLFRSRLQAAGLHAEQLATAEGLRSLPVMTRRDIQAAGNSLFCRQLPKAHLPVGETQTSGSSGEPVVVKRSAINNLFWMAATLREHLWQQRDFSGRLAVIRANYPEGDSENQADWGVPVRLFFNTGTSHALKINTDIERQAEWLTEINPDYLLTYPNNLAALLQQFDQRGTRLTGLRQIRTLGETLADSVRDATREILKVEIADTYSSQELGTLAMQCPESGLYHTMAESHIIEVLDEHGKPCLPGQIGRIIITDLHNFATPLIRYQIGDYAEVCAACSCGRGLPTLKRIAGRERNMLLLPDGRRHWPLVGFGHYRDIAPIRQYQLIQRNLESLEMRLVTDSPLSAEQEGRLAELVRASLGHAFQLQFVYFPDEIPRSRGGKFEEFICEASTPPAV
jgi:phenylacetate-coenzyme A ligase PaaK-like adenylate-forming protein